MEFMEPKDIDWSRVVSRYVRDETYEGIVAPRWADLADPNAGRADVHDEAWFCRPGAYASLSPLSPLLSPLAEASNAMGIRLFGGSRTAGFFLLGHGFRTSVLANSISTPLCAKEKKKLGFADFLICRLPAPQDGRGFLQAEPQPQGQATAISVGHAAVRGAGPQRHKPQGRKLQCQVARRGSRRRCRHIRVAQSRSQCPRRGCSGRTARTRTPRWPRRLRRQSGRPPFGATRWAKNAKEAIKSSAEKRPDNAEKEALLSRKNTAPRQLKSTLSARNLFSGKDILGQISEFYDELKRMVGGVGNRPVTDTQREISLSPV
ncbi:hypothetical protein PR202_ga26881 [Eleusine coracana subsp. coracana]|uniref:Uncharacterized protein n=1 Tax=Eleusine coracana subsp. coracana TaxID=191504 RepID=A0AAV5DG67_ELECO|nr:hypothetical protein PR202_ga26881 [Eleusine coracana subsp. coracana]